MCTGNICRSPMGEVLLRQRLEDRGLDARVPSSGVGPDGDPAHAHAREVMAEAGLDLSSHRSRIVNEDMAAGVDLVIGMEQRHVREVVVIRPELFTKAYTLPDLVFRAENHGARGTRPFDEWLAELGQDRKRADLFRQDRRLEVTDPIGGSRKAFQRTAAQLNDLLDRFVALAWSEPAVTGHH